jgi:hypothetical protein
VKKEIDEYVEAFNAHLQAQKDEIKIKLRIKSTYNRLMQAKAELKAKEKELLEDTITKYNE